MGAFRSGHTRRTAKTTPLRQVLIYFELAAMEHLDLRGSGRCRGQFHRLSLEEGVDGLKRLKDSGRNRCVNLDHG